MYTLSFLSCLHYYFNFLTFLLYLSYPAYLFTLSFLSCLPFYLFSNPAYLLSFTFLSCSFSYFPFNIKLALFLSLSILLNVFTFSFLALRYFKVFDNKHTPFLYISSVVYKCLSWAQVG